MVGAAYDARVVESTSQPRRSVDLSDVTGPLWRRRWLILAIVVLSTAATYLVASQRADRYRATASVLLQQTTVQGLLGQPLITTPERVVADQALLIASRPVAERVIARLGLDETADGVLGDVTAAAIPGASLVRVTAERPSASGAAQVANTFVREHIALAREQLGADIDRAVTAARAQLRAVPASAAGAEQRRVLREEIARLLAARAVIPAQARQVDVAAAPAAAVDERPERDALFAAIISALLAITLAYALEWYRRGRA